MQRDYINATRVKEISTRTFKYWRPLYNNSQCLLLRWCPQLQLKYLAYLYDGLSTGDLEDLTLSVLAVAKLHVDDLGVPETRSNR